MRCENYFCIYQDNYKCTAEDVEIDVNGQCAISIRSTILESELRALKRKLIKRYEKDSEE